MRFARPEWLLGCALALGVGLLLLYGSFARARARARFGDDERVRALVTSDPSKRRAWKGILLVVATALSFVAAARPQYGKGTRTIPATNIDIAIVLDFSKSMYARDVQPNRIFRAKNEVSRLVKDLAGARFSAVAFAGEPIAFPLTADGGAVAQFFRQLEPNDMPVGGTAIGRALDAALELLNGDPKGNDHKRVIVLVTDGEDLEGDPVAVARAARVDRVTIHVVQIGGRTPEVIPEVNEAGEVVGIRRDKQGQPLTTALSADGEKQLAAIASETRGTYVRAERGTTGIDQIAEQLRRQMTTELAERVEVLHADVYFYPLGAAVLLLFLEALWFGGPRRRPVSRRPEGLASPTQAMSPAVRAKLLDGAVPGRPSPFLVHARAAAPSAPPPPPPPPPPPHAPAT